MEKGSKEEMKKILEEIQSGAFAKEWMAQAREGSPYVKEKREETAKKERKMREKEEIKQQVKKELESEE